MASATALWPFPVGGDVDSGERFDARTHRYGQRCGSVVTLCNCCAQILDDVQVNQMQNYS